MSMFQPAVRKQAKIRLAITGPSGSGKTYSALLIASGIGDKIAVIDTENCSASLYAGHNKDIKPFAVLELEPPYTINKYLQAIKAAEEEGFDVLIIDSITHAWAGEGGLLDKKTALDSRGGANQFTNWKPITKEHEMFKSAILNSNIHVICTMRSKQDYQIESEGGKLIPKKLGLAPIQREGMEYEFTVVLDMAMDHNAVASKDRTSLFDGLIFTPTKQTGEMLKQWLESGERVDPELQRMSYIAQIEDRIERSGESVQSFKGWLAKVQKDKKYVVNGEWGDIKDLRTLSEEGVFERAMRAYEKAMEGDINAE